MEKKKIKDFDWEINPRTNKYDPIGRNQQHMKDLLNSTGPGFCLAKWTQVTMHLGNGTTHSCHHPAAHKIPLHELKNNPSALHNTAYKKAQRKAMLNGKRPKECEFCWRVEDNGETSDRVYKSLDQFSFKYHDKIAELVGNEDIFPTYVEVSFGNTCNFKCAYCGPAYSSQWQQEIKNNGEYHLTDMTYNNIKKDETHIPQREHNPYIEAFWEWFPEAYKHMHTFRITGGEPLLIKDTMKVIDFLLENPNPRLEFAINSNGCPPGDLWNEFTEKVRRLEEGNCVKDFVLFTSAEAGGDRNDYIRYGMDYELWKKNIEYFLENTSWAGVTCMSAFNLLSISSFKDLLEWILKLKKSYNWAGWDHWLNSKGLHRPLLNNNVVGDNGKPIKPARVLIDIPYLRHPSFLDANIASIPLIQDHLLPAIDFIYDNLSHADWGGNIAFDDWEANKLRRTVVGIIDKAQEHASSDQTTTNPVTRQNRARFYDFINEYDKRRNTNFLDTFPEFADFLDLCKQEHVILHEMKAQGKA